MAESVKVYLTRFKDSQQDEWVHVYPTLEEARSNIKATRDVHSKLPADLIESQILSIDAQVVE